MSATAEEVTTQIAEFTKTEASLTTLDAKYSSVPDATTKDGYEACVEAIRELRPLRTGLDKMRLKLNADDQARIKFRNTEAKRITARLVALEDPIKAAKQDIDDKAEREAEEARQAEQSRIEGITHRIAEIQELARVLPQDDADWIQSKLEAVNATHLDSFAEYAEQAAQARAATIMTLETALAARKEFEHQQAEQARVAKEQAEKQAELDKQAETQRLAEAEARSKLEAEQEAVRKAQKAVEDEERMRQHTKLNEERAAADLVVKENERLQKEADQRAEDERLAREAAEEATRLEALLPAREKLHEWAELLGSVNAPVLNDKQLDKLGSKYQHKVRQLGDYLANEVEDL